MTSSQSSPLVSVIIPNYNHARYLLKRIDSVLDQTFHDFELIILDDCSTDESREIINTYAAQDSRIRTYFNQTNSGSPFKQWNKGVKLAKGKYVWIAESDDYADPTFLEKLIPIMQENPQVGVAYCQSWIIDEYNNVTGNMLYWTEELDAERWKTNFMNNGTAENKKYQSKKPTIPNASAVLFRKQTYLDAGMADESFTMTGDWLMWIKMLFKADVYFLAESLNYFRYHLGTTRNINNNHDKVLKKIREEYQILAYLIHYAPFDKTSLKKIKRDTFARSFDFCPASLKFSYKFLEFLKIVKKVDQKVYIRAFLLIFKRIFTYIPEKISSRFNRF